MSTHVFCIDDDAEFLLGLKIQLKKSHKVTTAQSIKEGLLKIEEDGSVDLVLLDIRLGTENGLEGLRILRSKFPKINVVMMSGQRDPKLIVKAIRDGAADYLCKPFSQDDLYAVIEKTQKLSSLRERHDALVNDLKAREAGRPIIGTSRVLKELLERVRCVRGHSANILIEGESGTGKELLARYIHEMEGDANRPFIAVNCAAIPEALIESELFGHEKGAFSGAFQRKLGKFELANGGDIFLDEINSLKPDLQAKILRIIQEKEVYRVGGTVPVKISFRVIAASNAQLEEAVQRGQFRVDLFHRLRVVSFVIPALRERREDIPLLVDHFLAKYSPGDKQKSFEPSALENLLLYSWPGNARELENLVHSLVILSSAEKIRNEDLPDWLRKSVPEKPVYRELGEDNSHGSRGFITLKSFVRRAELDYIRRVMNAKGGDKNKTADVLGISRTSLYEKIKGFDVH